MPPSSMTGFARISFEAAGAKFSWELKSVNSRGLEIRARLPPGMDHLEPDIRQASREKLSRGSCFFALHKESEGKRQPLTINEDALTLVVAAARRLAAVDGIAPPTADGLLAVPGVLHEGGEAVDRQVIEAQDAAVLRALEQALGALRDSRREEGQRLGAVLGDLLERVRALSRQADELSAEAPEILRRRIHEQVALLTSEPKGLDPDRLHQEALIAATRADVREEIDRLNSHIAAAEELLAAGGNSGRRLEFLAQEFNREANTLCSKAMDRRMSAVGVELKAVIDQFREQVQNIE